jgi:hypothetical protein
MSATRHPDSSGQKVNRTLNPIDLARECRHGACKREHPSSADALRWHTSKYFVAERDEFARRRTRSWSRRRAAGSDAVESFGHCERVY